MNNKTKTRSLRVAIIAIALLLCFALAVGVTSALYQARRQATGTLNMDKGIVIDYKGFNKGDENIWQREITTSFKLFEETNAQPGQEISVYPSGIRANVDSINFYARLKLEYIFYNVANGVETKVDLPNPKSLIKTSNDFFASNWVPSTDGYYYFGENTTLNQFSKDNQNFENLFADGAKFIIEGANFEGETAGEGGGFVVNGTAINKIVVYLTLETLQGDATAEQAKDLGWVITTLNEQIVDITNIPDEKPEINIDDIISDDKKDGEITITGDPTQKLTITIGSKAFYGCSKLKLTLSNSENIEYRIATDAFSTGATIMYGIDNVSSKLINPSTTGHTTVGFDGKWQVSAPGLYLFLPSPITSTSSEYGDFQYTDDQGTWYFDLIDESGNKVDASTLSSTVSRNGASTFGASTYANTDNYTAKLNKFEPKDGVTTVVIPKYLGVSEDSNKFAVTKIDRYNYRESHGDWTSSGTRGAFYDLQNIYSISIPDSVTSIGMEAFSFCSSLKSITIGNGVTSIGTYAFISCSGLTSITIPDSVTSIGESVFSGCSGLTSVTIGNSVTSIGRWAFLGCSGLNSIIVGSGNKAYYSAGNCLIETKSKTLILGCKNSEIPIDGSVESIGEKAFSECTSLTSITIPDSVTSIGQGAFESCSGLTSITIPDSVTSIGWSVFSYCSGLTSITIPDSVTSIGSSAFSGCSGLISITIPNGVTRIEDSAFSGCDGLTSIKIGAGIQEVSWLPSHVAKITITISESNPYLATDSKAIFAKSNGELSVSKYISADTNYDIPSAINGLSVTSIGTYAFSGCSGLTSITIPDSVTSIGSSAFSGCSGLISITIPNGVTSIGEYTFNGCRGLTSITIPDSVTSIGGYAFTGCRGLTSITIPGSVTSIGGMAFAACSGLTSITIPDSVPSIGWSVFSYCSGLTSITIPDSVTSIGERAFEYCTSLTSVIIGDGVTSIGYHAFFNCSGLTSITIPDSVTSIENWAFESCSNLTSVTIGNSVKSIGSCAFGYCRGLTSITIPESVTSIGGYAFRDCSGLISITISNGVTSIGEYTFNGCSGLTSITIPDSVRLIRENAFEGCTGLISVTILSGMTSIGEYAFAYCSSLTSIVLPEGIKRIPDACFKGCTNLESITIPSTCTTIGNSAFENCTNLTTVIWNITYDLGDVNAKGPELSSFETSTTDGLTITDTLKSPTNIEEGFVFAGWTDGTTIYQPGDDYTFSIGNRKLTAVWKFIVNFDRNGGEGETIESVKVTKGKGYQTINFPDLTGTREGYKFLGWSLDKDATSATYTSGTHNITITESQTFYAIWKVYKTFTFNANGGEGEDVSITETSSLSSVYVNSYVNSSTFTRSGYRLLGFSTDSNATSANITLSSYIYFSNYDGDQTFYAIWQAYKTFTFTANGGEGEDVSVTETSSLSSIYVNSYVKSTTFTRSGYYLSGFSTDPNATTADLTLSSYISFSSYDGDQTFYAVWQQPSNDVTTGYTNLKFDLNGGEGKITFEGIYQNGDYLIFPEITGVTRVGYKFIGWQYKRMGDVRIAQPGTRVSVDNSSEALMSAYPITAQWEKLITVTINYNDGVNADEIINETETSTILDLTSYAAKVAVPEGQYLAYWAIVNYGKCRDSLNFNDYSEDITITPVFKVYETFTFNPNGGDGEIVTWTRSAENEILDFSEFEITREGYLLLGWSESPNADYAQHAYNDKCDAESYYWYWSDSDQNIVLYAVWEKLINDVTTGYTNVKFDLNGGTGKLNFSGAYRRGDTFKLPGIDGVTKDGYTFLGWSTSSNSTTPNYYPGNNMNFFENETYYAIWAKTITISFDLNGGEGILPDPVQTAYYAKIVFNTGKNFTKEGYKFAGWQLVDGNGNDCGTYNAETNQTFYNNGENYTFKAMWSEPQTITFYNDNTKSQSFTMTGFFDIDGIVFPEGSELTKEGYILVGWNTSANSSYVRYSIGQKYSNFSDYTELYAVWKSESEVAKIIFDFSEVEGQENIIKIGYDSSFGISDVVGSIIENIRNASGQAIAGWTWTQGSSNVDEYNDNWIYFSNYQGQTKTLYPVWKNVLTINFDLNGGEGTLPESFEVWERKSFDIPEVSLTKEGYLFAGWAWRSNSTYTDYRNGDTNRTFYESDTYGSTTLYAIWKQPLTISFDANGGTGDVPEDIITFTEGRFDIPKVNLTKDGYKFLGWSFIKNPIWGGVEYEGNGCEDRGYYQYSSKTLYAVWGNTVTYVFDLNGGTGTTPASISANYGENISVPSGTGLERAGYKFKGWSRNQNSTDYDWSSGTYTSRGVAGTITMYAVWEVLTDQVYVGSLTQAELDAVQALWNGHTRRSELTNDSLLNSMSNNKLHSRFSILGYLNNTSLEYGTSGDSYYGIGYGVRNFKLSTNSYTFEFENSLPTGWKLVNWRYEVKASGYVTIVNGRAQAAIDYTYAGFENSSSEERLMMIFVLPNQPAASESVSVSIGNLPGNALEALLSGNASESLSYFVFSGIKIEIYDSENNLLWTGNPNSQNQGFVTYRFATATYKLRIYTTNVSGIGIYDMDQKSEITGLDISAVTKGDGYSEFTINYTFSEGNPNLAIFFKMADIADVTKTGQMYVQKEFCGPQNVVGTWFNGFLSLMGIDCTDMSDEDKNYAGYCGMLLQEYFNFSICKIPSFSIYTAEGKIFENIEEFALAFDTEYTIKFTEEVKEVMLLGNDSMSVNSITSITYNETTGTWDATFSVSESTTLMFLTADLDLSQYEDLPAYDAATDYSEYLQGS